MSNALRLRPFALTALLALLGVTAQAQETPPTPAPPAGMAPMPAGSMSSGSMSTGTMAGGGDFSLLSSRAYDYIDLQSALARGYSLGEVATTAKIARLTGLPFESIFRQVAAGRTFAWLASDYSLRLGDVLDASDEQARIAEYFRLYELRSQLGQPFAVSSASYAVSGPSLAELEARYNQLNAQFPALPPTTIDAAPPAVDAGPAVAPPIAAPPPAPAPEAAPPAYQPARTRPRIRTHVRRPRRHHTHRTYRPRRHRYAAPSYMRRGS